MICKALSSLLLAALLPGVAHAQSAAFDLAGPQVTASVTRGGVTLPIARVPQLSPGDRLTVAATDPSTEQLLVVAFLRGAASPPPKSWFVRVRPDKRKPGPTMITVPEGAQQAVMLVAADVGGGYDTLVGAVRGRPGIFVRASQDLGQASLDRARLETFLTGIHAIDASGNERLDTASATLANSLAIRWNADCLQRQPELQAACLTQNREALILHDGRSASLIESLTGAPADIAYRVAATPEGGSGYYSPYIGLVRDIARLLGGSRSPQFQYIPGLALGRDDRLALLLNTAPSFRKPHSVIVAPLAPVQPAEPPVIRASAADALACATRPNAVLPIEGAPLLYATSYAHGLHLRVATSGGSIELPVAADARKGGFVLTEPMPAGTTLAAVTEATLHGQWGFTPFSGPRFRIQAARGSNWGAADEATLVVGRDNALSLLGGAAGCVASVSLGSDPETARALEWKATAASALNVTVPLRGVAPGSLSLWVRHYGEDQPVRVLVKAFQEASRIDGFVLHAGDDAGLLTGARLDQVSKLTIDGLVFTPGALDRVGTVDQLVLTAAPTKTPADLAPGRERMARISLKDGRTLSLKTVVAPPRPKATLIGTSSEDTPAKAPIRLQWSDDKVVSRDSTFAFSLQADGNTRFNGSDVVELATVAGTASAKLAVGNGLTLADERTLVGRVNLGTLLGPLAFGPARYRLVQSDATSDWQPLTTIVRLPGITAVDCAAAATSCTLAGADLFLIERVASDAAFRDAVDVPRGFTGSRLPVPRSANGQWFMKLRDAPETSVRISAAASSRRPSPGTAQPAR